MTNIHFEEYGREQKVGERGRGVEGEEMQSFKALHLYTNPHDSGTSAVKLIIILSFKLVCWGPLMGEGDSVCMWGEVMSQVWRILALWFCRAARRRKLMEGVKLCHFVKVHSINFVD